MISIAKPIIGEDEVKAVTEVLRSGVIAEGQKVKDFEAAFAQYSGTSFAVAVNSGTAALHASRSRVFSSRILLNMAARMRVSMSMRSLSLSMNAISRSRDTNSLMCRGVSCFSARYAVPISKTRSNPMSKECDMESRCSRIHCNCERCA